MVLLGPLAGEGRIRDGRPLWPSHGLTAAAMFCVSEGAAQWGWGSRSCRVKWGRPRTRAGRPDEMDE